jgi:hypothetical protein
MCVATAHGALKWRAMVSVLCVMPALFEATAPTPSLRCATSFAAPVSPRFSAETAAGFPFCGMKFRFVSVGGSRAHASYALRPRQKSEVFEVRQGPWKLPTVGRGCRNAHGPPEPKPETDIWILRTTGTLAGMPRF